MWSLYTGGLYTGSILNIEIYTRGPIKCGIYKQVVFIYRWTLEHV